MAVSQTVGTTQVKRRANDAIRQFNNEDRSGFTVSDDGKPVTPDTGYIVTITNDTFAGTLTAGMIRRFIQRFASLFTLFDNVYVGTFQDYDGYKSIDLNIKVEDKETATRLGKRFNQKAVWDCENHESVPTGGNGKGMIESPVEAAKIIRDIQ